MAIELARLGFGRIAAVGITAWLVLGACPGRAEEAAADLGEEVLRKIEETYDLEIRRADAPFSDRVEWGWIRGEAAPADRVTEFAPLFARELALYPLSLVEKAQLERVVFCRDLSSSGVNAGGLADYLRGTIYLDVMGVQPLTMRYACAALHHEFFHLLDFADDGVLLEDKEWSAVDAAGLQYRRYLREGINPFEFIETSPGFLTGYCLTTVTEDKAEVFAHLMVNGAYVESRAKRDPLLRAKVDLVKGRLAAFCPQVDDKFWASARRLARPGPEPLLRTRHREHAEKESERDM